MSLKIHALSKFSSRFFDNVVAKNESGEKMAKIRSSLGWFQSRSVCQSMLTSEATNLEKVYFCLDLFSFFSENLKMSSRSPVTYTRSPTQHDKDDPVVIKVLAAFCKLTSCLLNDHLYRGAEKLVILHLTPLCC